MYMLIQPISVKYVDKDRCRWIRILHVRIFENNIKHSKFQKHVDTYSIFLQKVPTQPPTKDSSAPAKDI